MSSIKSFQKCEFYYSSMDIQRFNMTRTRRSVKFNRDERFLYSLKPRASPHNQHNRGSLDDNMDASYKFIVQCTFVDVRYGCWVVDVENEIWRDGVMIGGQQVSPQMVVYLYHRPGYSFDGHVVPLCANECCCNPRHLRDAADSTGVYSDNNRLNCPGTIAPRFSDTYAPTIRVCKHKPPCNRTVLYEKQALHVPPIV